MHSCYMGLMVRTSGEWVGAGLRMCILTDVSKITIYFEITKIETISGETTPGVCIHLDEH